MTLCLPLFKSIISPFVRKTDVFILKQSPDWHNDELTILRKNCYDFLHSSKSEQKISTKSEGAGVALVITDRERFRCQMLGKIPLVSFNSTYRDVEEEMWCAPLNWSKSPLRYACVCTRSTRLALSWIVMILRTSKCDSLKFSKDSYCTVDMQWLLLSKLLIKYHQFVLYGDLIDPSCRVLVLCALHKDILISTAGFF